MKRSIGGPEGFVVVDKPAGCTSHDVVGSVRRALGERRVGGLGVFLMRQMMDSVRYQRLGARNQLQMTKRLGGGRY